MCHNFNQNQSRSFYDLMNIASFSWSFKRSNKLHSVTVKNQFDKKEQVVIRFFIIGFAKQVSFKIRHHDVFMSFNFIKARF